MQILCGLQVVFFLFNCQTPVYAGVDPKTVQYLAGHENSKTTMDIYARVKYNKPEQLFDVVNSAFHQAVPS